MLTLCLVDKRYFSTHIKKMHKGTFTKTLTKSICVSGKISFIIII